MLQNYNRWRILRIFFDDPNPKGGFQLREISRKAGIAPTSVKRYLNELSREGKHGYPLVIKSKHRVHGYPLYWANRDSELFLFYKKIDTIIRFRESGLLDFLWDSCMPETIILFGSAARGEDLKDSDIDIFAQCRERRLNLTEYEKRTGRRINVLFAENFNKLSGELKNNILNGIVLKGYLKAF